MSGAFLARATFGRVCTAPVDSLLVHSRQSHARDDRATHSAERAYFGGMTNITVATVDIS